MIVPSDCIATNSYWTTLEYDACNVIFMEFVDMASRVHNMWRYERAMGYMTNQLLKSFSENMFWQQTRLSYDTFCFIDKGCGYKS